MTELAHNRGQISKCPFYADCVCMSDSDDTYTVISDESCSDININSSLNSGSEFEEFPPIKCRYFFIHCEIVIYIFEWTIIFCCFSKKGKG